MRKVGHAPLNIMRKIAYSLSSWYFQGGLKSRPDTNINVLLMLLRRKTNTYKYTHTWASYLMWATYNPTKILKPLTTLNHEGLSHIFTFSEYNWHPPWALVKLTWVEITTFNRIIIFTFILFIHHGGKKGNVFGQRRIWWWGKFHSRDVCFYGWSLLPEQYLGG